MRESRIRHPAGATFVKIHHYISDFLSPCDSAVMSVIEFKDRLNDAGETWIDLNAESITSYLRGLYARKMVQKSVLRLLELGWIDRDEDNHIEGNLWKRVVRLRLNTTEINKWIDSLPGGSKKDFPEGQKGTHRKGGSAPCAGAKSTLKKKVVVLEEERQQQERDAALLLPDGTSISCKEDWKKDLEVEVLAAFSRPDPPTKTQAAYAAGILKNWEKSGAPSGAWKKKQDGRRKQQQVDEVFSEIKSVGNKNHTAASRDAVNKGLRLLLEAEQEVQNEVFTTFRRSPVFKGMAKNIKSIEDAMASERVKASLGSFALRHLKPPPDTLAA
jgi:hypothetical protein